MGLPDWANVPLATLINLTVLSAALTTCTVPALILSLRLLTQKINTDKHVLAVTVIGITDDRGASLDVSTLQVEQLIGKLDAPDPVSTGQRDRHDKI
jgi:hypothetical protein